LVEVRGNVANFVEVLRSHLTDVEVDHVAVVGIYLGQFVLIQVLRVEPVLDVHVLVGEDH
jgi:hypothetical protein